MCREKYNCSECPYHGLHYCHSILCRDTRDLLKAIVMCKDCKYGNVKFNGVVLCSKGGKHEPDWFCADGERRTDDA